MKITPTQYAKSLYAATVGKSSQEIDVVLQNFVKILAKNKQLKFRENIIVKFEEIYNQENGIVSAEIVSREKLDDVLIKKLENFLKDKYGAKEVVVENKVDKDIKGGMIIKVGDEVWDGSLKRQLINLSKILNK